MKTLVVSDLHLGCKYNQKLSFLSLIKNEKFDRLIINGDFIDGWRIQSHGLKYFDKTDVKIIKKILSFSKDHEVILIKGNHDEFLSDFINTRVGNIKIKNSHIENGILFLHGDGLDAFTVLGNGIVARLGDIGYNLLLRLNWIFRFKKFSLSKKIKENVKKITKFIGNFETAASFVSIENNCHTVICGHIHTPSDKFIDINNKRVRYINSGDWQENQTYVIIDKNNISVSEYKFDDYL